MSPKQRRDAEQRARDYIDQIININRQFGMGGEVADETYERAVKGSVRAVRGLIPLSN